jgi:ribonuclease P protein component
MQPTSPPCGITSLRRQKDFDAVFASGQRFQNSWLTILVLARPETGVRVGFCIGKRLGGAVVRNRLRRRLREAWRKVCAGRESTEGWDVVCLPRSRMLQADYSSICAALHEALVAAKMIS